MKTNVKLLAEERARLFVAMRDAQQAGNGELFDSLKKELDPILAELYIQRLETLDNSSYDEFGDGEPVQERSRNRRSKPDPALGRELLKAINNGFQSNQRGITSTTGSGVVQDPLIKTSFFAEQMSNQPFFQQTGIQVVPKDNYSLDPKFSDPAVVWQNGEGTEISESPMTISGDPGNLRTGAILVKYSKQLARDGGDLVTEIVNAALLKAFANELGRVALRGSGTTEPLGLDGVDGIEEYDVSGALITTWGSHLRALNIVHQNNAMIENCSWVGGSNVMLQVEGLDDSTGQYLAPPPVLASMPFAYSSHVAENYSTNKTRIYIGDLSNVTIGVSGPFILPLSTRYADFLQDAFLLWFGCDVIVRRPSEICIIKNIGLV